MSVVQYIVSQKGSPSDDVTTTLRALASRRMLVNQGNYAVMGSLKLSLILILTCEHVEEYIEMQRLTKKGIVYTFQLHRCGTGSSQKNAGTSFFI